MSQSKKNFFDGTDYEQLTLFALPVIGDKIAVSCFDGQQIEVKDLEPWMVKLVPDGEFLLDKSLKNEYNIFETINIMLRARSVNMMASDIPSDGVVVRNARLAVAAELKKKRVLNQPIARFDPKTGKIYMEHTDGSITDVGKAMRRGRYSERRK